MYQLDMGKFFLNDPRTINNKRLGDEASLLFMCLITLGGALDDRRGAQLL